MQSQKRQKDLCSFPRQTIQYHSNPSLCTNQLSWRSWSWMVLWRSIRPSRTNTQKRCPFHYRGLECKSRKSRDTWSNGQVWPWSTKWSRPKANKSFAKRTYWSWQTPSSNNIREDSIHGHHQMVNTSQHQSFQWNIQNWFPLGLTGLISLQSKGLSRIFCNTVQKHQFFRAQLSLRSNSHIHTWLLKKP